MEFTDEELVEIEKMADRQAGHVAACHADFIQKTWPAIERLKEGQLKDWDQKITAETVHFWDMLRTISAKCQQIRKKI
jgi:hypothetical protein